MNPKQALAPVPNIGKIIAIASGKGGVGKSTLTVNLALALARLDKKVGILDADIYGPSFPTMLGLVKPSKSPSPSVNEQKKMLPIMAFGLPTMSIGYLIPEQETPMVWRGPMVSQAIQQLTFGTLWPELDYLLVDLPPGTGDIQLTLLQKIPVDGVIIITTPQEMALADARKALNMFKKFEVPILGIVENMSHHICSSCGHNEAIFGSQGGEKMAEKAEVPFLGQVPIESRIQSDIDNGTPTLACDPESKTSVYFQNIAKKLIANVAILPKQKASKSTNIAFKQET